MKRILTLFMALVMCFATSMNGYAATAKIDAGILKLLNTVNFTNAAYDQKPETKKWLDSVYKEDNGENDLYWLYSGHTYQDDFAKDLKMVSKRTVAQAWKLDGKVDKTLGQAYVSKVNLTIGELEWYYSTITVKAWVKKVSGVNKITKVDYAIDIKYSAPSTDTKFIDANKGITYKNSYIYTSYMFSEAKNYEEPDFITLTGMTVTPDKSLGFMSDSVMYAYVDVANYKKNTPVTLGEVTPKDSEWVSIDSEVYGLSDNAAYDMYFVDKATGEMAPKDSNFLLESGKTYLIQFKTEGDFSKYYNNQLLIDLYLITKE